MGRVRTGVVVIRECIVRWVFGEVLGEELGFGGREGLVGFS